MKTIKKQLKSVTLILSVLILFQGCIVYKSAPISLEEASKMDKPVRVITKNDVKVKYDRIIKDNGNYYTVKKEKKADVIKPIDTMQIREVKEKDKTASFFLNFGGIILGFGVVGLGLLAVIPIY